MPDGKVTAAGHFHALVCIEVLGAVVTVDMQKERARLRMLLLDEVNGGIEQLCAQMLAGERISLAVRIGLLLSVAPRHIRPACRR